VARGCLDAGTASADDPRFPVVTSVEDGSEPPAHSWAAGEKQRSSRQGDAPCPEAMGT
jgi:hypothetical protein